MPRSAGRQPSTSQADWVVLRPDQGPVDLGRVDSTWNGTGSYSNSGVDPEARVPLLSADGRAALIRSTSPLSANDTNAGADLYRVEIGASATSLETHLALDTATTPPGATSVNVSDIPTDALTQMTIAQDVYVSNGTALFDLARNATTSASACRGVSTNTRPWRSRSWNGPSSVSSSDSHALHEPVGTTAMRSASS